MAYDDLLPGDLAANAISFYAAEGNLLLDAVGDLACEVLANCLFGRPDRPRFKSNFSDHPAGGGLRIPRTWFVLVRTRRALEREHGYTSL
jgi:hypothetical protein